MIYLQLFFEFFKAGLFAIGGGLATIPFLTDIGQRTGGGTSGELATMIAISESTPGPMGVNMAPYVGFHTGGIAYPLELASGRVSGPGRNNTDLGAYTRHPASGAYLPGFQIPFWPELTACVRRAMDRVPGMGYVGWDIAVTPDGPELIEGNWHWPGGNIIQFDGVGKYPLLRDCAGETDEEHPH